VVEIGVRILLILGNLGLALTWLMAWSMGYWSEALGLPSPIQLHIALGSVSVLISRFGSTCILFYFIGTSLWLRDRSRELVRRDREGGQKLWALYESANRLKAAPFPFATFGLLLGLFAYILGGATQVGALPGWIHPTLATLLLLNNLLAMLFTFKGMKRNVAFLDQASRILDI
jgi:hypothetical protein